MVIWGLGFLSPPISTSGWSTMASGASRYGTTLDGVETMMKELGLHEEDRDDVVLEQEVSPTKDTLWMVIVRVHTDKT